MVQNNIKFAEPKQCTDRLMAQMDGLAKESAEEMQLQPPHG